MGIGSATTPHPDCGRSLRSRDPRAPRQSHAPCCPIAERPCAASRTRHPHRPSTGLKQHKRHSKKTDSRGGDQRGSQEVRGFKSLRLHLRLHRKSPVLGGGSRASRSEEHVVQLTITVAGRWESLRVVLFNRRLGSPTSRWVTCDVMATRAA